MNQSDIIQVLIADDHPIVRQGLVALLEQEPDIRVVAQAGNGEEAIALFHLHQPDVTLMDLRMPQIDGVTAITQICGDCPDARIIVLTTYDGDEDIYRGLQAGAKGYLLKDTEPDELITAMRRVAIGNKYIPFNVGVKLSDRLDSSQLSDRELDVIRLIIAGETNQQISQKLKITESTVKYHINNILGKLGARDRTQAAIVAVKRGIVPI